MSRSKWKGLYIAKHLIKKNNILRKLPIKIWNRNSAIPFYLLNKSVEVYNGKEFTKINISREKIGFKFGEFVGTRKIITVEYLKEKKKKKKKKKK